MQTEIERDLYVSDAMNQSPITIRQDNRLDDALTLMAENHISGLPVIDGQGRCVGVITSADIVQFAEGKQEWNTSRYFDEQGRQENVVMPESDLAQLARISVGNLMTRDVLTVCTDSTLKEAAVKMMNRGVHRVLVIDRQQRLRGILTSTDFVRLVAISR